MADAQPPFLTFEKTPAEEQEELNEVAAPLTKLKFPAAIFNRVAPINAGFTYKSYLALVRTVARFDETNQLPTVTSLGIRHHIFDTHTHVDCTIKQFVALARFLKSKEGKDAIIRENTQAKLRKRDMAVYEPANIALESILQIQRQDYSQCMEFEMLEYQEKIVELRTEIRRLEKQRELRRREVNKAFVPVSIQKEFSEKDVNSNAWELYASSDVSKKMRPLVKRQRDIEFLQEGENSKMLFDYAKSKLLSFQDSFDVKAERNLKNLLAAASGGEIDAASINPEESPAHQPHCQ